LERVAVAESHGDRLAVAHRVDRAVAHRVEIDVALAQSHRVDLAVAHRVDDAVADAEEVTALSSEAGLLRATAVASRPRGRDRARRVRRVRNPRLRVRTRSAGRRAPGPVRDTWG
jgi:hypothetical protein